MNESPNNYGAFIAKLGAWLQLAQLLGIGGTMIGMSKAFSALASTGAGDPAGFSEALSNVLVFVMAGLALTLIGLVLVTIAITASRYRAVWMYNFLCFYGLLIIGLNLCFLIFKVFILNIHLPFGIFFLVFAQVKRKNSCV